MSIKASALVGTSHITITLKPGVRKGLEEEARKTGESLEATILDMLRRACEKTK